MISLGPNLKLLQKNIEAEATSSSQTNFCSRHLTEERGIYIKIKYNNYCFPRQTVGLYWYLQSGAIRQITATHVYLWPSAKRSLTDQHARPHLREKLFTMTDLEKRNAHACSLEWKYSKYYCNYIIGINSDCPDCR